MILLLIDLIVTNFLQLFLSRLIYSHPHQNNNTKKKKTTNNQQKLIGITSTFIGRQYTATCRHERCNQSTTGFNDDGKESIVFMFTVRIEHKPKSTIDMSGYATTQY